MFIDYCQYRIINEREFRASKPDYRTCHPEFECVSRHTHTQPPICHPELVSGSDMFQCLQRVFALFLLVILGKILKQVQDDRL